MKYGITLFPTDYSVHPGELAAAAEERGFESLWVPEHSHLPVSEMTPGPHSGGLPKMYYDLADPFVALSMAAQATRRLLLGTSICLVVQRDPIQLAKQVASLDALSGGRFLFGVGGGWNALEMADHGTRWEERLAVMRERIEAMRRIWTEERAEYHGEHVDFAPLYAWPKPAQKPHPPIHVGANLPGALRRLVAYGDGWLPILTEGQEEAVLSQLPALREALAAAGRDPERFEVSIYMCPRSEATLQRCREAGVARAIFLIQPRARDAALAELEECAALADRCK